MSTPGDQVGQAASVRVPKRFPLASKPGFRATTVALSDPTVRSPVSDAVIINSYAELDPEDGQYWIEKRLGLKSLRNPVGGQAGGVGIGYAAGAATPLALTIFGLAVSTYDPSGFINVPYMGTNAQPWVLGRVANFVQVTESNVFPYLFWAANGNLWGAVLFLGPPYYKSILDFSTTVPWTVPLCDGCVFLDGVLYVMDQLGNIWGSDNDSVGSWTATTLIKAGGRSDLPVCLVQQLEYVIALKSTSLRCFYDSGAAAQTAGVGSNLAWVEGADANYGCANAGSVQLIDQSLLWLTNNDKSTPQIARMDGLQVTIISTPAVERLLQQLPMATFSAQPSAVTNIVYSAGIKRGGHRFYVITATTVLPGAQPFSLIYDLDQQMWYLWMSPGLAYWSVTGVAGKGSDTAFVGPGVYCQDISSGQFYVLDIDQVYPTDAGIPAQVDIYTPSWDAGTKRRKQLNAIYFQNDQVSGSKMFVRKSDNDYRSWSPFRAVSLSDNRPSLTRCGSFTKRALNLRHAAPTPFRIKSSDLQLDIGTI